MEGRAGNTRTGKVLKTMGIFSSVQFVTLASGIARTKLVAIWIGTVGVGLFGIYNSAIDLISTLALLGIGTSAVRNIAMNSSTDRVAETIAVVRRWGCFLGLLGTLVMIAFSPLLSKYIFGDTNHIWAFAVLGPCIFLNGVNASQTATMQGTGQLKNLARATMSGLVVGVLLSIPLFYIFGTTGIPPSILICSVCTVVSARIFGKYPKFTQHLSLKRVWRQGNDFVRLGFFMMLSQVLTLGATFLFLAWLTNHSGTEDTGRFQAGFTLFNRYVGLVFTALSVEFYPRLAAQRCSCRRMSVITSHELMLICAVLLPLLTCFAAAVPLVVRLLYSKAFLGIVPFVTIALAGTVLRAVSWCMGFSMIARGHGRIMLLTEGTSALLYLGLNIVGWIWGGLIGVGIAYIIWYLLYTLMIAYIYIKIYRQKLSERVVWLSLATFLIVALSSLFALISLWWISLIITLPASLPLIAILYKLKK